MVLHLEKEIRLNGQGAPDNTTLVPLNSVNATPSPPPPPKKRNKDSTVSIAATLAITKRKAVN